MDDTYLNYAHLASEMSEGRDYRIRQKNQHSRISIMAPHGGKIEKGTSELAEAIALEDFNFYAFEGKRPKNNKILHITSHRFDEPNGLKIAKMSRTVIGVHGRMDCDDLEGVYLGGLDSSLVDLMDRELTSAGYLTKTVGHKFLATNPKNICNLGVTGRGAQFELSKTLRCRLIDNDKEMAIFSSAIRAAILQMK